MIQGQPLYWRHRIVAIAGTTSYEPVPAGGRVTISHVDTEGVTKYWNGTAWATTEVELATTVVGSTSVYQSVPEATKGLTGRTIKFEGYILDSNGNKWGREVREEQVVEDVGLPGADVVV